MSRLFGPENAMYVARILALCFAVPMHELAHAFISDKLGDHTARDLGRLTLNPVKHLDPMGFLAMLIVGVGWAKPVPVNPSYYKNRKLGMAVTAVAGPISNLLLAYIALILEKVVLFLAVYNTGSNVVAAWPVGVSALYYILYFFVYINISLALFNLLPIPPLDGSRILGLILPEKLYFGIMHYERIIMIVLVALLVGLPYFGFSPLGWLLGPMADGVLSALDWMTGYVDSIFRAVLF